MGNLGPLRAGGAQERAEHVHIGVVLALRLITRAGEQHAHDGEGASLCADLWRGAVLREGL
jgi:hypothetical protein